MSKKPKIRHLAIMTLDPERLAKFYEQTFEMTRLTGHKGVPGSNAVYMTDGYITLALLPNKAEGKPSGLNHFGWQVEDQDEIAQPPGQGRRRRAGEAAGRPSLCGDPRAPIRTATISTFRSRASARRRAARASRRRTVSA